MPGQSREQSRASRERAGACEKLQLCLPREAVTQVSTLLVSALLISPPHKCLPWDPELWAARVPGVEVREV